MAGLSAFGRLYRISRLNSLTMRKAIDVLGIPKRVVNEMRYGLHDSFQKGCILDAIEDDVHAGSWPTEDDLMPFQLSHGPVSAFLSTNRLHGCPVCLRSGFHSLTHQARWIDHCPWHNEPLIDHCRCGKPLCSGLKDPEGFILACPCGHDFFDRLTALKTLSIWPENEVKRAIRHETTRARRSRAHHLLQVERGMPLDIAVTVGRGGAASSPYVLETVVDLDCVDAIDESACRAVILGWDNIETPSCYWSLPLLSSDLERVQRFSQALQDRLHQIADERDLWHIANYDDRVWSGMGSTIANVEYVNSRKLSDGNLELGHSLIERFVEENSPHATHGRRGERWPSRRDKSMEHFNEHARLLAHVLSAHGAQCLFEYLMNLGWRAFAGAPMVPLRCSGKTAVVRKSCGVPSATVLRVLPRPRFDFTAPDQSRNLPSSLFSRIEEAYLDLRRRSASVA